MNRFNNIGDDVINNYFYQSLMNEYAKTRSKLTIEKTN